MKKALFCTITLLYLQAGISSAQKMVTVNRWVSPVVGDFVSVPENKGTDDQMISWGYKNKTFQYEAFPTKPAGNNVAVVNRWEMPGCKDFILMAEHELSDQQMLSFGYKNKQFLFYAYRTKPATGKYVAVSRWVNALPAGSKCKDFTLSVAEHELTDAQLTSWGYTGKKVQFYVPDPRITSSSNLGNILNVPYEPNPLIGYVDMHAHPMAHLAFGGKCLHGAPDVGVPVPAIPKGEALNTTGCFNYKRAENINEALCNCNVTHGGWSATDNQCGDDIRKGLIRITEESLKAKTGHHEEGAKGFPELNSWPAHNDLTHQQMWVDWVKRTYQNGLRVMVALSVNNATYSAAFSGLNDINPDDVSSSNIQITEMIKMVDRHNGSPGSIDNWMEIARTPKELRRIVRANKLAIVLGIEVDNIGNFHKNNNIDPYRLTEATKTAVRNEITRIFDQGVRYIFPIHVIDNKFGGSAVYESTFDYSNYHQTGKFWDIDCASPSDSIGYNYKAYKWIIGLAGAKMGVDIARRPPTPRTCDIGHKNKLGLTPLGQFALSEMMKKGMIVDIDHMSDKAVEETIRIAERFDYPLNSGHNGIRPPQGNERALKYSHFRRLSKLGGMAGVGTDSTTATAFQQNFLQLLIAMNYDGVAVGTDANGMVKLPVSTTGSKVRYDNNFPMCKTGNRSWDYNKEGVAHYGLLPDFFKDVQNQVGGQAVIDALNRSAEYFAKMWEKCERQKLQVR